MLEEIKERFEFFSDALIKKISYEGVKEGYGKIVITLNTMDSDNNDNFSKIKLIFKGIQKFRLIEQYPFSSLIINQALLIEDEEGITFDFFPEICDDNRLKEDPNSDLLIKCQGVSFKVIEKY